MPRHFLGSMRAGVSGYVNTVNSEQGRKHGLGRGQSIYMFPAPLFFRDIWPCNAALPQSQLERNLPKEAISTLKRDFYHCLKMEMQ